VCCTKVTKIDQDEKSVLVEAETADGIKKFESSISSAGFEGPLFGEKASPVTCGPCRFNLRHFHGSDQTGQLESALDKEL
jgi:hypothetical protein